MENLEDALKFKEDEIAAMTNKAASLSANQNSVDSFVAGLQESLNSKEKQIERFGVKGFQFMLNLCKR